MTTEDRKAFDILLDGCRPAAMLDVSACDVPVWKRHVLLQVAELGLERGRSYQAAEVAELQTKLNAQPTHETLQLRSDVLRSKLAESQDSADCLRDKNIKLQAILDNVFELLPVGTRGTAWGEIANQISEAVTRKPDTLTTLREKAGLTVKQADAGRNLLGSSDVSVKDYETGRQFDQGSPAHGCFADLYECTKDEIWAAAKESWKDT